MRRSHRGGRGAERSVPDDTARNRAYRERVPLSTQKGPTLLAGTALAEAPERAEAFDESVRSSQLSPELWTGAFATNVWGGRYEIDGFVGEGAQGATFTGLDLKTGAKVAVKVFDFSRANDWKAVDLFEREAKTLARLEHAGIPAFLDVIDDDSDGSSARALVMTLVPGETYNERMRAEGTIRESELWTLLLESADVLAFLHREGVVHRDVKPRNLIRRPDGRIALVDFGGVGQIRGERGSTVVGTFGYMAPEQLYGTSTPATDVYALGATTLALATGVEPEDHPRKGLAIDVDKAAPHLSAPLRKLLGAMLSPDPDARPQNGATLLSELDALSSAPSPKSATGRTRVDEGTAKDRSQAEQSVDAQFRSKNDRPAIDEDEILGTLTIAGSTIAMILGILGTVATVVVGEVILPVLFGLLRAFAPTSQKAALKTAQERVAEGTKAVKSAFETATSRGTRGIDEGHRRRERGERKLKTDAQVFDRKRRAEREAKRNTKRQRPRSRQGRGGSGGRHR